MRGLFVAFMLVASVIILCMCVQSNIGLILHAVEEYELSLRFLEHALTLNIRYEPLSCLMPPLPYPQLLFQGFFLHPQCWCENTEVSHVYFVRYI